MVLRLAYKSQVIMKYVISKRRQSPTRQIAEEEDCAPGPLARVAKGSAENGAGSTSGELNP
jgi:hypothetical protein